MNSYDKILDARDPKRLTGKQLVNLLTKEFIEFHGDRLYADDSAIVGGIGRIRGQYVTIIAEDKGEDLASRVTKNFGMAHPEGFRKALRLIKQAEKFNRPIILIMDTAGAYPGIGAEERGQGSAIANLLYELSTIKVPVVSILLSEGGSGGALALGVCDYLLMFENSFYSVISPEGFASILYKGEKKVQDVIDEMKILPENLEKLGIIDEIITEPKEGLTVESYRYLVEELRKTISNVITDKAKLSSEELIEARYERYRKFGNYE